MVPVTLQRARHLGAALALVLLVVLVVLASGARAAAGPDGGPALASLAGAAISEADFQSYLEATRSPEAVRRLGRDSAGRQAALEAYLDARALAAKARRQGIGEELGFKKALELVEARALAQLATERLRARVVEAARVTPAEVRAAYEARKAEFTAEPRFSARHLVVYVIGNPAFPERGRPEAEARARAELALRALRAGQAWDDVTRTYSDEPSAGPTPGVIRDAEFGHFAPEVERAVRTQPLGVPVGTIRSAFGFHVLQVEARALEPAPLPFSKVKALLAARLADERVEKAREALLAPVERELGLELTEAGRRDASLIDEAAFPADEVLATVAGRPVREADFRWFVRDALVPGQRASTAARPGARLGMLRSYLRLRLLEAKARRDGLDLTPAFAALRAAQEEGLLGDFMRARDGAAPPRQCSPRTGAGPSAERVYLDAVRAEVGLALAGPPHAAAGH